MNTVLNAATITGQIGAGSVSLSDYLLKITPTDTGYNLNITRGTEEQTLDISNGIGIKAIEKVGGTSTVNLYRITLTDGRIFDYNLEPGEEARENAEAKRVSAESARVNAENERAQAFAEYQGEIDELKGDLEVLNSDLYDFLEPTEVSNVAFYQEGDKWFLINWGSLTYYKYKLQRGKDYVIFSSNARVGFSNVNYSGANIELNKYYSKEVLKVTNDYVYMYSDKKIKCGTKKFNRKTIFFDDFDNQFLNENVWSCDVGVVRNSSTEAQYYRKENVNIVNGCLKLTAKRENYGEKEWTSGSVTSGVGLQFGVGVSIKAKIKLENMGDGAWPAFWTVNSSTRLDNKSWPNAGEIDVFEAFFKPSKTDFYCSVHYYNNGQNSYSDAIDKAFLDDNWHEWELVWTKHCIALFVDGVYIMAYYPNYLKSEDGYIFSTDKTLSHQIIFDLAIDGNNISANSPSEMAMYIDYVKVDVLDEYTNNYLMLSENSVSVAVNDVFKIVPLNDVNSPDKSVVWEIEDEAIVTHNYKTKNNITTSDLGSFKALLQGKTNIIVTDKYGNKAYCKVTVE